MIGGTPTVLLYAACYTIPGTHVLVASNQVRRFSCRRSHSTAWRRAPVPADETAGAGLSSTVETAPPLTLACTGLNLAVAHQFQQPAQGVLVSHDTGHLEACPDAGLAQQAYETDQAVCR